VFDFCFAPKYIDAEYQMGNDEMAVLKEFYTIKLHDTDAAGILFFANQFRIVHDIYERFLAAIGFAFQDRFSKKDFLIPIVHAEADFNHPLTVGDVVEISLTVAAVGKTSFTLEYYLTDLNGATAGYARTVHVTIDAHTMRKMPLPQALRQKLEEFAGGKP
jgi:1,4-dihydroxy-2-naphthoyl-CoA hydrolase